MILVTGAGGFLGAACVRQLLGEGHKVLALDPYRGGFVPQGAALLESEADLATARPDAILHLAAFSDGPVGLARSGEAAPERALEVNLLGFHRLLRLAAEAGVRRVVWSSSTVAIGPATGPDRVAEEVPCAPITAYGLSKHLAEQAALYVRRRHGLDITGVRLPLLFGPGLWYDGAAGLLARMVAAAAPGAAPEFAAPEDAFDAAHVADAARLFALLLARPGLAPLYHLAGFTTRWAEIAATLAELVPGYAPRLNPTPAPITWPLVSQARLEQDTGFACTHDLRATLRDLLETSA
ncbi:NAD(P)-dependent oxidoreductase [Siccirubricoccus sp. KC 17139]|uniref:NAD(P)-dependent oxidoreductase n=1 Tax=Siccirubricoccus soli TaxID=2899147 RepID=A0ABT1D1I2_9PROT|nr:NAD(P)-dependent oxidoreductase [Siccirubricoccus soli]MCO6415778.1 NAD(P)-dependent oxidoreductase [Siccirubricoccus soli]MCP2681910.1 NAD(P)-dependent oxidoreductase [Siccirubricoccus soli]